MKKLIRNFRNRIAYKRITRIAETCYYDSFLERHVVDLRKGYLFYYPAEGKITTTLKGLVFKNKKQCHFTRNELKQLLKDIENATV